MTEDYSEQYERLIMKLVGQLSSFIKHEWELKDSKQRLSDLIAGFEVEAGMLYKKRRGLN